MKNVASYFVVFLISSLVLSGCNDDPDDGDVPAPTIQTRINLIPTYNGEPFEFQTPYTTQEGYTVEFSKLNVIMTDVRNGDDLLTRSMVYKFEDHPSLMWQGEGDFTSFSDITADIGVGAERNNDDPSALPADDPLNILNTDDMHWGWNTGYIFLMIEGRVDTTSAQSGENIATFMYHVGSNDLLKSIELNNLNWNSVSDVLYETNLTVDIYKVFDGDTSDVDIKEERTSHTTPSQVALSDKIISNFASAMRAE